MAHPGIDMIRQLVGDRAARTELPTVEERRAELEAMTSLVAAPEGVTVEPLTLAGRPAERTTPATIGGPGVVLYTHGGAYVSGGLGTHRAVVGRIALASSRPVVALDYRLRSVDGRWRIVDIYLNGTVSELALRRSEYSALIQREGFKALLVKLDERINDLKTPSASQS